MASLSATNLKIIQNLEKKAFRDLSKPANQHGIALISSIAFLVLALLSSMMALPSTVTYSSLGICLLSSIFTYRFYKILQKKISEIIDEKSAHNIQSWDIKKANIFSYYIVESEELLMQP